MGISRFVVVRDPADRLLSGFLNKCVGREWQNCPYVEFMPHRFNGAKHRDEKTDAVSEREHQEAVHWIDFLRGRTTGCLASVVHVQLASPTVLGLYSCFVVSLLHAPFVALCRADVYLGYTRTASRSLQGLLGGRE